LMAKQAPSGNAKYKKNRKNPGKIQKSNSSSNPDRVAPGKTTGKQQFFRSKSDIKLLKLKSEKPDLKEMHKQTYKTQKIRPDRKWFGNVRTIDQKSIEKFRVELEKRAQEGNKSHEFLIKSKKLPMSLVTDAVKEHKLNILEVEKYEDTFGPKSKRKRVKIDAMCMEELAKEADDKGNSYDTTKDRNIIPEDQGEKDLAKDKRLEAGQSKRIWEELYKVIDSSDIICQVIDARDPMGTRTPHIEEHLRRNCKQKHLIFIMNKCDLVPTAITKKWLKVLGKEFPTIAYHASITNPFGKGSLLNLLRQFDNFHKDRKTVSVGFIGYPNVGKSSVINSLKQKKVCRSAPIPGETKVWQYVNLTKRIYLIDCPGVVYQLDGKDESEIVMKGVVRAEKLEDPEFYIPRLLQKAKHEDLKRLYGIDEWVDHDDFLSKIAKKKGKLLKAGEPDMKAVAKLLLIDWQRGEIPFYCYPPNWLDKEVYEESKKTGFDKEIEQTIGEINQNTFKSLAKEVQQSNKQC